MSDLNFPSSSVHESTDLPPSGEEGNPLRRILAPVAHEIAEAREATNGIVMVVHRPKPLAKKAMKKLGVKLHPRSTTVVGMGCRDAVAALGHDPVTRRWCAAAPEEGQIKVFLIAGDGTALLTLNFTEEGIKVEKEPDLYAV